MAAEGGKRRALEVLLAAATLAGVLLTAGAVGGGFNERVTDLEEAQRNLAGLPEVLAGLKAEVTAMHQDVDRIDARQETMMQAVISLEHREARKADESHP